MSKRKLLNRVLRNQKGVRFSELRGLVEAFGFELDRVRGSHHIYKHEDVSEFLNLQSIGGEAKPYQVRQFLDLVEEYNLSLEDER